MFTPQMYRLLDFGDGRRLEQFGPLVLDRPCPAVEKVGKADPAAWQQADARFQRTKGDQGQWLSERDLPERWTITHGPVILELKRTEFGHLGVFPEQAANWDWISQQLKDLSTGIKVLNLFAYTGGSTLIAAALGAEVTHVDAARNIVAWARRNAELSHLADAPIRWIVEDAMKFVRRELKRGNQYDAVILDPPSYGHGRRGEVWRLSKQLPQLLEMCGRLTAGRRRFILLTCHTPKFTPDRLKQLLSESLRDAEEVQPAVRADAIPRHRGQVTAEQLTIPAASGRELPSAVTARWLG